MPKRETRKDTGIPDNTKLEFYEYTTWMGIFMFAYQYQRISEDYGKQLAEWFLDLLKVPHLYTPSEIASSWVDGSKKVDAVVRDYITREQEARPVEYRRENLREKVLPESWREGLNDLLMKLQRAIKSKEYIPKNLNTAKGIAEFKAARAIWVADLKIAETMFKALLAEAEHYPDVVYEDKWNTEYAKQLAAQQNLMAVGVARQFIKAA